MSLSEEASLCLLCFSSVDYTSEERGDGKEDVRLWTSESERSGVEQDDVCTGTGPFDAGDEEWPVLV